MTEPGETRDISRDPASVSPGMFHWDMDDTRPPGVLPAGAEPGSFLTSLPRTGRVMPASGCAGLTTQGTTGSTTTARALSAS